MDKLRRLPASLQQVRPITRPFNQAHDPAQRMNMDKPEAQQPGGNGRGSTMVKRHRPFPDLRPKEEREPIRQAFNRAWLKEQREAMLAHFERQRQQNRDKQGHDYTQSKPAPARGYIR